MARVLDKPWPYFTAAGLLLVVAIASQFEIRRPQMDAGRVEDLTRLRERDDVNVLFVLIDTLRADHLGVYGYERDTSPNLGALAAGGIVFRNAVAQSSWTKTSMAALWTATRPINNGIVHFDHVIPPAATLPAEIFREAGFRTAGIFRNGWVAPNFGFDQGFETYVRPRVGRERARVARNNPTGTFLPGTDEDLVASALEFLDIYGHERFFLYLHFMDVHQYVYDRRSPDFGTRYLDTYDRAIHWTDRLVAHLVEELGERDLRRKTLLVIGADHGEAFMEHGWEGHAKNLYNEVTGVPLIIVPPFYIEGGVQVESVVSNMDVWPTVLDILGLDPIPGADGRSLLPRVLAAGRDSDPHGGDSDVPVFSHLNRGWGKRNIVPNPLVGVRKGRLQLFYPVNTPERAELYDLVEDPAESRNLYADRPELVAQIQPSIDGYLEGAASPWGVDPERREVSELQLGQLKALGYVIE